jgi:hypothetical protein
MPLPPPEIVQFRISRDVAEAVRLETVNERARAAGVPDPRLEYSTKDVRGGGYRITCRVPMVVFLNEQIAALMEKAEGQLVIDLAAVGHGYPPRARSVTPQQLNNKRAASPSRSRCPFGF